jgi:hypothetical protein
MSSESIEKFWSRNVSRNLLKSSGEEMSIDKQDLSIMCSFYAFCIQTIIKKVLDTAMIVKTPVFVSLSLYFSLGNKKEIVDL